MKIFKIIKFLRSEIWLYLRLFRDSRTPPISKIMLIGAMIYLLSPIDFIPDFIPFAGFVDEIIVIPLVFYLSTLFIPKNVIEENKNPDRTKAVKNFFRRDKVQEGVVIE